MQTFLSMFISYIYFSFKVEQKLVKQYTRILQTVQILIISERRKLALFSKIYITLQSIALTIDLRLVWSSKNKVSGNEAQTYPNLQRSNVHWRIISLRLFISRNSILSSSLK